MFLIEIQGLFKRRQIGPNLDTCHRTQCRRARSTSILERIIDFGAKTLAAANLQHELDTLGRREVAILQVVITSGCPN